MNFIKIWKIAFDSLIVEFLLNIKYYINIVSNENKKWKRTVEKIDFLYFCADEDVNAAKMIKWHKITHLVLIVEWIKDTFGISPSQYYDSFTTSKTESNQSFRSLLSR